MNSSTEFAPSASHEISQSGQFQSNIAPTGIAERLQGDELTI
jgi:hypothetical protein